MNEKRYVVKSACGSYYTGSNGWTKDLKKASMFANTTQLLIYSDWFRCRDDHPRIIEVERVPQPEWREVREL